MIDMTIKDEMREENIQERFKSFDIVLGQMLHCLGLVCNAMNIHRQMFIFPYVHSFPTVPESLIFSPFWESLLNDHQVA
jgi:hypothetical protein